MQKKNAGFSYVEVLAAGALFVIVLLGVLPLTLVARQNLSLARENLRLSHAADSLSLAVRDMLIAGTPVTAQGVSNLAQALGVDNYSVFIFNQNNAHVMGSPFHSCEEFNTYQLTGFNNLAICGNSRLVYVIVRNEHNVHAGRAISTVLDFRRPSGIWRS